MRLSRSGVLVVTPYGVFSVNTLPNACGLPEPGRDTYNDYNVPEHLYSPILSIIAPDCSTPLNKCNNEYTSSPRALYFRYTPY